MELEFIRIGYMDSRFEKSMKPLTAEVLEQLTWSEKVRQTMERIKATNDQEEKNRLKQQLPVVLFNCQMTENGERPSAENKLGMPGATGGAVRHGAVCRSEGQGHHATVLSAIEGLYVVCG